MRRGNPYRNEVKVKLHWQIHCLVAPIAFVFYGLMGCLMKDFWQHDNGKVYAVRCDSFGRITGAAGPFEPDDLGSLEDFRYGPGIVTWIEKAIAERKLRRINVTPIRQVISHL